MTDADKLTLADRREVITTLTLALTRGPQLSRGRGPTGTMPALVAFCL